MKVNWCLFLLCLPMYVVAGIFEISDINAKDKCLYSIQNSEKVSGVVFGRQTVVDMEQWLPDNFVENYLILSHKRISGMKEDYAKQFRKPNRSDRDFFVIYEVNHGMIQKCYFSHKVEQNAIGVMHLKNARFDGLFTVYDETVKLGELNFVDGKKEGKAVLGSGSITLSYSHDLPDGRYVRMDGETVTEEKLYKNGKLNGVCRFFNYGNSDHPFSIENYNNGILVEKTLYDDGVIYDYCKYFDNGKLQLRKNYKKGVLTTEETFDETGESIKYIDHRKKASDQ